MFCYTNSPQIVLFLPLIWVENIFFRTYIDDKQGVMALDVEELEEFVPVPPRPAVSLNSFFRHDDRGNREQIYAKVNDALSPSSNLNRRSDTSMLYNGLSHTSAMNVRYVRLGRDVPNSAPQMPSPSSSDMHLQNGDVHRNNGPANNLRNGIPLASIPENRNEPPNSVGNNLQAANGREKERQRPIADLPDGDIADMDRWLESVFDQALDGVGNDYGDVQSLGRRIMGGGEDEASLQVRMNCESFQFFSSFSCMPLFSTASHLNPALNYSPLFRSSISFQILLNFYSSESLAISIGTCSDETKCSFVCAQKDFSPTSHNLLFWCHRLWVSNAQIFFQTHRYCHLQIHYAMLLCKRGMASFQSDNLAVAAIVFTNTNLIRHSHWLSLYFGISMLFLAKKHSTATRVRIVKNELGGSATQQELIG